jgi:hypothetical protein
VNPSDFAPEA